MLKRALRHTFQVVIVIRFLNFHNKIMMVEFGTKWNSISFQEMLPERKWWCFQSKTWCVWLIIVNMFFDKTILEKPSTQTNAEIKRKYTIIKCEFHLAVMEHFVSFLRCINTFSIVTLKTNITIQSLKNKQFLLIKWFI